MFLKTYAYTYMNLFYIESYIYLISFEFFSFPLKITISFIRVSLIFPHQKYSTIVSEELFVKLKILTNQLSSK